MLFAATLLYAGLLGLILLTLSARVVQARRSLGVGLGTGGDRHLECLIRAQANFCEYVPLTVLLLLLLEASSRLPGVVIHILGSALVASRVLHGFWGLNRSAGTSFGRFWGTALHWLVLMIAAILAVVLAVSG